MRTSTFDDSGEASWKWEHGWVMANSSDVSFLLLSAPPPPKVQCGLHHDSTRVAQWVFAVTFARAVRELTLELRGCRGCGLGGDGAVVRGDDAAWLWRTRVDRLKERAERPEPAPMEKLCTRLGCGRADRAFLVLSVGCFGG